MSEIPRLLLTPIRAAEQLDVCRTTVYELMATGELESVRIGRSRRIPAQAVEQYVARLRTSQSAQAAS